MCECETVSNGSCFAKCKTKRNVIDVYMSHFNRLREVAQQQYAIDSMEFLSYVPIGPDYVQHFERRQRQRRRHLCHHSDANANTLFSATSLKYFAQFVVQCIRAQFKRYFVHIVICATVIVLVNYRIEATNAFMRNIQTSIYPMMRGWRKITLPLIGLFPVLTELYDETCLIENPLFRVANLDCTPCTGIAKVTEHVASFPFTQFEYSVPHIVQAKPKNVITIDTLRSLYDENRMIFQQTAYRVHSTNPNIRNLDQLFDHFVNKTGDGCVTHNMWHINRMTPARVLRQVFATPKHLPKNAGIGIDRYVIVDGIAGPSYKLPTTDCSNMFVYQANGSRRIQLQPTIECTQQCSTIYVRLKRNQILFYDWWYWKPVSAPDKFAKTMSISYVGSYC